MRSIVLVFLSMLGVHLNAIADDLPTLRVSQNNRYLEDDKGRPFFWMADTVWELFHRSTREDAIRYLDHRAANGFNVIQAVAIAELDGLHTPNAYGHQPFIDLDPTKPMIIDGPNNDYWDHVDFVVQQANQRGIYVGLLPTWGDKWNKKWGAGPEVFTAERAYAYGEWIAKRYANAGVVWILGGDRPIESDQHRAIIESMAKGLKKGDLGKHLITFHPVGGSGSSVAFPDADWLSFHMRQNGHGCEFTGHYDTIERDYHLTPIKPVLDGEPIYEDHPVSFDANKHGHSIASDVRRPFYWDVFQGACGHTYGHHSVWQFASSKFQPVNKPLMSWDEAIEQPGALQMKHGRKLIESRPYFSRIPDNSLIITEEIATKMPGAGRYRFVGTRDVEGTYAMIYAPIGRVFQVNLSAMRGTELNAWWFNPRNGEATQIASFEKSPSRSFSPPNPGEYLDWVLVIDDASCHYPPPGQSAEGTKANGK